MANELAKKISELDPLPDGDMEGFFTIGSKDNSQGNPVSYKMDLVVLKNAIAAAASAVTQANNAVSAAQAAQAAFVNTIVQQTGQNVDKTISQKVITNLLALKYEKPSEGIPASDIASGVIPDVSSFITKSVDDLANYYLKSETYTKSEVQALIAAINQFHYEIYASISEVTSPATNVLYLIGPTGSGADKYEEYVYSNGAFVKIGDTSIDLSGYVTTTALNTTLANYTTTTVLTTLLAGKVDKVNGKGLSTNDFTTEDKTKLSGIASGAQVNVIETVKVNGTALTPSSKAVNIDISGKADKDTDAVEGNIAKFDASGNPVDSGIAANYISQLGQEIVDLVGYCESYVDAVQGVEYVNLVQLGCKENDKLFVKLTANTGTFEYGFYYMYKHVGNSRTQLLNNGSPNFSVNQLYEITVDGDWTALEAYKSSVKVLASQSNVKFEILVQNGLTDRVDKISDDLDSLEDTVGTLSGDLSTLTDTVGDNSTSIGDINDILIGEDNYVDNVQLAYLPAQNKVVEGENNDYRSSKYIEVVGGKAITIIYNNSADAKCYEFDSSKIYIKHTETNPGISFNAYAVVLDSNTKYIRFSWQKEKDVAVLLNNILIYRPCSVGIESDLANIQYKETDIIESISCIGNYVSMLDCVSGKNYRNIITGDFKAGDAIYVKLSIKGTSTIQYNLYDSTGVILTGTTGNKLPVNSFVRLTLPHDTLYIYAYIGSTLTIDETNVKFEIYAAEKIANQVKELVSNYPIPVNGSVESIIELPSTIYGFSYRNDYHSVNPMLNKLNFMHRLYIEGIAKGNYKDLRVNGEQSTFVLPEPSGGEQGEGEYNIPINISCGGFESKDVTIPLKLSNPYNLVGKDIRLMHIGDSLTDDGEGGIAYATKAILDRFGVDYGANHTIMVGTRKGTHDYIINGEAYSVTANHEGYGGWGLYNLLRHIDVLRKSSSDTTILAGKAAWDSLGLGTKSRNGIPSQTYVDYDPTDYNHLVLLRDTSHGYYDADPSQELWIWLKNTLTTFTYNGVTYDLGSVYNSQDASQQTAIKMAVKYKCEHPVNPFFDIATVEVSSGGYAFNFSTYINRYRTIDDTTGERLTVNSPSIGTKITVDNINNINVCTPTHVCVIMAHNHIVPDGVGDANDDALIAQLIKQYNSNIKVSIGVARTPGAFNPNHYNWSGYYIVKPFTEYLFNIYSELKEISEIDTNFDFLSLYAIQTVNWGASGKSIDTLDMIERCRYVGDGNHARSVESYFDISSEVIAWLTYLFRESNH